MRTNRRQFISVMAITAGMGVAATGCATPCAWRTARPFAIPDVV